MKPVYSMPQEFFDDKNVAIKWKLYGLINGFWINGLTVYAANKFFAEKLGTSERSIRSSLEELEKAKLIRRDIHGYKRNILPFGQVQEDVEAEAQVPGGGSPGSAKAEAQVPPNASSIASNKIPASAGFPIETVKEDSDLRGELGDSKSPRISGDKRKAYDELIAWSEKERGFAFPKTTRLKQYRAFKLANENGITRDSLMERWQEMAADKFWQKTGFDWMNVLQTLLVKPV